VKIDSDLVSALYQGVTEEPPWQHFAEQLRLALNAKHVGVTLHHAQHSGHDIYVLATHGNDRVDWVGVEETYRREFMADDPYRLDRMEPGTVLRLDRPNSGEQYQNFLQQIGINQSLRSYCADPSGFHAWLDVTRGSEQPEPFSDQDMALLEALLPHLEQALGLYATINRLETECALYEGMIEHMTLGCVLLNRDGGVIRINDTAESIIAGSPMLNLLHGRLQLTSAESQRSLERAIEQMVSDERSRAEGVLVKVGDYDTGLLGLLVYPAPASYYYRGEQAPAVIIYLSNLKAGLDALRPSEHHSLERVRQLLGLTQREATLALLLASGYSIADAARYMTVGEAAVRNYSKNIYSKLGISSQTDLVRIVLRSFSFLK